MIKVTVSDILNAIPVFNSLMEKNFKGTTSFKIAKLVRELNIEIKTFEETRDKLINEYAEKDENGEVKINDEGNIHVKDEYISNFNEQINQILSVEVEINTEKIDESCFDEAEITPMQSLNIIKFIN